MKCPNCGLLNPESAARCDCGYDFASRQVLASYLTDKQRRKSARQPPDTPRGISLATQALPFGLGAGVTSLILFSVLSDFRDPTGTAGIAIVGLFTFIGLASGGLVIGGAVVKGVTRNRDGGDALLFGGIGTGLALAVGYWLTM